MWGSRPTTCHLPPTSSTRPARADRGRRWRPEAGRRRRAQGSTAAGFCGPGPSARRSSWFAAGRAARRRSWAQGLTHVPAAAAGRQLAGPTPGARRRRRGLGGLAGVLLDEIIGQCERDANRHVGAPLRDRRFEFRLPRHPPLHVPLDRAAPPNLDAGGLALGVEVDADQLGVSWRIRVSELDGAFELVGNLLHGRNRDDSRLLRRRGLAAPRAPGRRRTARAGGIARADAVTRPEARGTVGIGWAGGGVGDLLDLTEGHEPNYLPLRPPVAGKPLDPHRSQRVVQERQHGLALEGVDLPIAVDHEPALDRGRAERLRPGAGAAGRFALMLPL